MKIFTIIGARPQFIKAAMVSRAIKTAGHNEFLVHTGQHYDYEMSKVFFDQLGISEPDINLGVGSGSHGRQTGQILIELDRLILDRKPDWVLIYGDTNSTAAGALAAAKQHSRVAHVESGLRSFNRMMPEELNRIVADHLSDILFCPSETAVKNLASEGITKGVHLVGDVMAEAIEYATAMTSNGDEPTVVRRMGLSPKQYLLATVHRQENTDNPARLKEILSAFFDAGEKIVFPAHPSTLKAMKQNNLSVPANVEMIDPVGYFDMVNLERSARMVLTDSGGVQKEAYWLGIPCITMRDETEWVETVDAGWNVLTGTNPWKIVKMVKEFAPPESHPKLYSSGRAGAEIADLLARG